MKKYVKPSMEIILLKDDNVIITSGGGSSCTPVDAPGYDDWLG